MPGAVIRFALDVPPGSLAAIRKAAGLAKARSAAVVLTWYDTPEGKLARQGEAVLAWRCGARHGRRISGLGATGCDGPLFDRPEQDGVAPAEAAPPEPVPPEIMLPEGAGPVCRFVGRRYLTSGGGVDCALLEGRLEAGMGRHDISRLVLTGAAVEVAAVARLCPGARPPLHGVSFIALALAGLTRIERPTAMPALAPGVNLSGALGMVCTHFGALLQAMAPDAVLGMEIEPVHQMRVAVRRLRSAFRLVRRAAPCAELTALAGALRTLGQVLGPARDWDVFLAGLGRDIALAMPGERAVERLIRAAERERMSAYARLGAHLGGEAFAALLLELALAGATAPWWREGEAESGLVAADIGQFAVIALGKQWRRLLAPGRSLEGLPVNQLHDIRIEAKRMRYAAELFAPLFPRRDTERLIARLKALQDLLGHLNDGAVARGLMDRLGPAGQGFAAGVVHGYAAATGGEQRADIDDAWRKLRKAPAFWG